VNVYQSEVTKYVSDKKLTEESISMAQDEESYEFTEIDDPVDEAIIDAYREAEKLGEYSQDVKDAINDFANSLSREEDYDLDDWIDSRKALKDLEKYREEAISYETRDKIDSILTDLHMEAWRPARDEGEPEASNAEEGQWQSDELEGVTDSDEPSEDDIEEQIGIIS
jgi:hypothetical protein